MTRRLPTTYSLSLAAMLYGIAMISMLGWHVCWQTTCSTGIAKTSSVGFYFAYPTDEPRGFGPVLRAADDGSPSSHDRDACPFCLLAEQSQQISPKAAIDLNDCCKQKLDLFLASRPTIAPIERPITARGPPLIRT